MILNYFYLGEKENSIGILFHYFNISCVLHDAEKEFPLHCADFTLLLCSELKF